MAEFIVTEAADVDLINCSSRHSEGEGEDLPTVSDSEFIDDSEQSQQSEYPYFTNVTRTYNDTMPDNIENLEDLDARHYFDSDDDGEDDLHDFLNFEAKAQLFRKSRFVFLCNSICNSS